jgi:hypothetical protein
VSRLRTKIEQQEMLDAQRAAVDQALAGSTAPPTPRSPPADERRLRGTPVVGGCPGAIPGTRPDTAVR